MINRHPPPGDGIGFNISPPMPPCPPPWGPASMQGHAEGYSVLLRQVSTLMAEAPWLNMSLMLRAMQ